MWNLHAYLETERLRHKELMRQAQQHRLARIVVKRKTRRLPRPMLLWTGRRLLASGQYLLTLAGDAPERPVRAKKFSGA